LGRLQPFIAVFPQAKLEELKLTQQKAALAATQFVTPRKVRLEQLRPSTNRFKPV
jgi:hypothetical protein